MYAKSSISLASRTRESVAQDGSSVDWALIEYILRLLASSVDNHTKKSDRIQETLRCSPYARWWIVSIRD